MLLPRQQTLERAGLLERVQEPLDAGHVLRDDADGDDEAALLVDFGFHGCEAHVPWQRGLEAVEEIRPREDSLTDRHVRLVGRGGDVRHVRGIDATARPSDLAAEPPCLVFGRVGGGDERAILRRERVQLPRVEDGDGSDGNRRDDQQDLHGGLVVERPCREVGPQAHAAGSRDRIPTSGAS